MFTDQVTHTDADLYKVLNVDSGADAEVIRAAYRALARRDHPDVSSHPAASSKMAELNAAFEVLGDAERRAEYDRSRRAIAVTTYTPPVDRQPLAARAAARAQSGTVLGFGRYAGWLLADVAREDPNYLEWLARTMIGRGYQEEIDKLLAPTRPRPLSVSTPARGRRGLFGRLLG